MNIKVVSEKTGLTKRAIKYYESEGLISPLKNNDNNYREYTDNDIVKLNLIGALRIIDIPICEIKSLVKGDKGLQDIMNDTLIKVTETINNLEKTKLILSNLINKETKDYYSIGEQVIRLRETLELSLAEKKEFVSNALIRIFPGNFGEIFVSRFKPFLNITIDNNEKKEAWLKLVEVLDNLDELNDNDELAKGISSIGNDKIQFLNEKYQNDIVNLLSGDMATREEYKQNIISMIKLINETGEDEKNFTEAIIKYYDMFNIGVPEKTFYLYLEMLNEDYKRYTEIDKEIYIEAIAEIKNELSDDIKSKLGLSSAEFIENLKN
ncbi:MerR family transcriptional regulator (plasmid) [Clostridium estertheticum]|uniref:MerR family transcriptional regulator n=1 Tax=Clostridium estertheticum TaxID=238834 RepID=UPI001C0E744E|nr:MerR family transcriptional regulator [Clostridium estertheticum]MBU3217858.1 MerR family transcriptional regulator [Clostridium estertheticum]WAG58376.1 MerR family transcriptional regulator [Clostridium estertheticum]